MAPASQITKPNNNSWPVVAIVFIALFFLVLFGSSLVISYFYHQHKRQPKNVNPYLYGSEDWLDYERIMAPQAERDALTIANLESRISVQEQYNQEADRMIELLDQSQKHLTLRLRDEQRKSEPIDPDIFQRIYDDIHRPLQPPRPSLPPLAAKSSPSAQFVSPVAAPAAAATTNSSSTTLETPGSSALSVVKSSPTIQSRISTSPPSKSSPSTSPVFLQSLVSQSAPVLIQTAKLRDIMRRNSRRGSARSTHLVEHPVKSSSAILVDDTEFEDVDLSSDDDDEEEEEEEDDCIKPAPAVGKKSVTFHIQLAG